MKLLCTLALLALMATSQAAGFNFFGKCFTDTDCKEGDLLCRNYFLNSP